MMAGKKKGQGRKTGKRRPAIGSFINKAISLGAKSAKAVRASTIVTAPWVRLKCRFGCGGYGKSLLCPPNTPTPEEMTEVIDAYKHAILFEHPGKYRRDIAAKLEREIFLAGYYKALGFAARSCRFCDDCAVEDGDCRHPERARPTLEACGIDVYATLRNNGIKLDVIRGKSDPAHFYGLVLIE